MISAHTAWVSFARRRWHISLTWSCHWMKWMTDVIWKKSKFCMIYQISGCMHATKQILVSFRTFSKTINLKNNKILLIFLWLILKFSVTRNVSVNISLISPAVIRWPNGEDLNIWSRHVMRSRIRLQQWYDKNCNIDCWPVSFKVTCNFAWPFLISLSVFVLSKRSRCPFLL